MTEYRYGITGKDRKALVLAISEILGIEQKYCGSPKYEFIIGNYMVDRNGTLTGPENISLVSWLEEKGFYPETGGEHLEGEPQTTAEPSPAASEPEAADAEAQAETVPAEAEPQTEPETAEAKTRPEPQAQPESETMTLTIEYPLESMTDAAISNLRKLVASKEPLLKMALGVDELPILLTDSTIQFPWIHGEIDGDAAKAYAQLIVSLCEAAKRKKRVTAGVVEPENPRFQLRVFLVSLGMIGREYAKIRQLMIKSLPGESGWRYGKPKKAGEKQAEAEDTPIENVEAANALVGQYVDTGIEPVERVDTENDTVEQG